MHAHIVDASTFSNNILEYINTAVKYVDIVVVFNFDATVYTDLKKYVSVDSSFKLTTRSKGELVATASSFVPNKPFSIKEHYKVNLHNSKDNNILNLVTVHDSKANKVYKVAIFNNIDEHMKLKVEAEIMLEMRPTEQDMIICTQEVQRPYVWLQHYKHSHIAPNIHAYSRINDTSLKVSTCIT